MHISLLTIVGSGDIGSRVARLAATRKVRVHALSRGNKFSGESANDGITFSYADLDEPETLAGLNLNGSHLLYSAPPPGGGIRDTRVAHLLAAIEPGCEPAKIVYLSATSVYGDCGDEVVDETRTPNPATHTGKRRLDAEQQFLDWGMERGVPVVILRMSGIYGPGRIPLQRIHDREPLLNEAEAGYTNRIHADDLAAVCIVALETGESGDIFNVCDGEISKMTDYFNAITDLLGVERLPQVSLVEGRKVMSPLMLSYMTESRKLSNKKMLAKLKVTLQYPTLLKGLKASL